jgi:hypothetical protein
MDALINRVCDAIRQSNIDEEDISRIWFEMIFEYFPDIIVTRPSHQEILNFANILVEHKSENTVDLEALTREERKKYWFSRKKFLAELLPGSVYLVFNSERTTLFSDASQLDCILATYLKAYDIFQNAEDVSPQLAALKTEYWGKIMGFLFPKEFKFELPTE